MSSGNSTFMDTAPREVSIFLPGMETVGMCPGNANPAEQSSAPLKHGTLRTSSHRRCDNSTCK